MTNELLKKPVSFAEYLLLPYDRKRTELVDGHILEMSEASPLHVLIITTLQYVLKAYFDAESLNLAVYAGTGIEIPRSGINNVRDPDLVVCDREQFQAMLHLTKAIFLEGNSPALAIEVVSPGNQTVDTVDKRLEYALAKVPEYWIVNPIDSYVLVLVLEGHEYRELGEYRGDELIESRLLPALKVKAREILNL
ncbi:MAG: Uma2 family endonuclease [Leptolyngbya sp. SIO4C1]|nr:Uma2 family endonuclease [Leptolyngbya sp. SIO4C1]